MNGKEKGKNKGKGKETQMTTHKLSRTTASTIIQKVYRGYMARKACRPFREKRVRLYKRAVLGLWNVVEDNIIDFAVSFFRR